MFIFFNLHVQCDPLHDIGRPSRVSESQSSADRLGEAIHPHHPAVDIQRQEAGDQTIIYYQFVSKFLPHVIRYLDSGVSV